MVFRKYSNQNPILCLHMLLSLELQQMPAEGDLLFPFLFSGTQCQMEEVVSHGRSGFWEEKTTCSQKEAWGEKKKEKKKSDRMIMLARCRSWYIVGTKWGYVKLKLHWWVSCTAVIKNPVCWVFFKSETCKFYVANLQNSILFGVNRILVKSELIIKEYQVVSLAAEFSRSFRALLIVDRWLQ